ncbi:C4-dicarboxylate TRAP transporter substrate-binding protein [Sneathiella marina]|uniref:C4-dicarboxylate TRAP transporter substrate-binding protein n=1 Tax=Sneathiella marina TaxID=2950108 RepID=A0ABY4W6N5_9PROT|nr:C4-dicarboxylate TRAP transporter substrate-binding protein [Sneathiella marina]USG61577.1 C4-dicarboxylate TRAP transporter substrate-binding protein [Sneathiella marina]
MKKLTFLSMVTAFGLMGSTALADSYQASTWLPQSATTVKVTYSDFAEAVKKGTGGEVSFDLHVGGALLPAAETLQGVSDGVAAVGDILSAYTPADLPLNNVVGDLGFLTDSSLVASFAAAEVKFTNQKLREEWLEHNVVFGGNWSTSEYHFRCGEEIRSLADVKGKRVRASVGAQIDFLKSIEAIPVSVPGSEIYTALERGSLDCTLVADESLQALKLGEVIKFSTEMPMGVFIDGATWGFNRDFWTEIGAKNRRVILDEMAKYIVLTQVGMLADDETATKDTQARGVKWLTPESDLALELEKFRSSYLQTLAKAEVEKRKIEDPSDIIDDYIKARDKWTKLLANVDKSDSDALIKLVRSEIYSKVDEKSYGVK